MTPERRLLPRLARIAVIGAALSFLPAKLSAQGVDVQRLWSYDTGG